MIESFVEPVNQGVEQRWSKPDKKLSILLLIKKFTIHSNREPFVRGPGHRRSGEELPTHEQHLRRVDALEARQSDFVDRADATAIKKMGDDSAPAILEANQTVLVVGSDFQRFRDMIPKQLEGMISRRT
jgi:hypothetical protein